MGRNYRKRKAFCERPFALHRQQPEKDKRSFDVPPLEKVLRTTVDALISIHLLGHKAWCCLVQFVYVTQKR